MVEFSKNKVKKSFLAWGILLFLITGSTEVHREEATTERINKIDNKIEKSQPEHDQNAQKENPLERETSSLLRIDLLDKAQKSSQEPAYRNSRNIFWRVPSPDDIKNEPPLPEKKEIPIEPEIEIPPINLKVKGFIEKNSGNQDGTWTRFAIIILNEKMHIVKKGDLIDKQYEILEVGGDQIKVFDNKFDRTEIFFEQKNHDNK